MADLIPMLAAAAGAAAGGGEVDPNFNQTVLLLHGDGTNGAQNNTFLDSSTNNFTITRNGNTTQGTFSPYYPDGYWSFNSIRAAATVIKIDDHVDLRIGTNEFVIEAMVYIRNFDEISVILSKTQGGLAAGDWSFEFNTSGQLRFAYGTSYLTYGTALNTNQWYSLAVTRNASNLVEIWVDGVSVTSATISDDLNTTDNVKLFENSGGDREADMYVSNLRFVNGSSYTPTVPTTPLTAITNTVLLTCQSNRFIDNSSYGHTLNVAGDVRISPYGPFAPSAAYDASVNGGSGYFDGTGDYLNTPSSGQFAPTGDFTVAWWYYPTTLQTTVFIANYTGNNSTDWSFETDSTGDFNVYLDGSTQRITGSTVIKLNQWNYLVVSRSGTTVTAYCNGSSVGTYTLSGTFGSASKAIRIGGGSAGTNNMFGYCAGVSLIDGTALDGTIPTAPPTAVSGTELLCNFTNAGIFDNTGKNVLETVGNAQIDTTTKKFGTGSMEFDGTGDYLSLVTNPHFAIWNGANWTIEFFIYLNSLASSFYFLGIGNRASTTTRVMLSINTSGNLQLDWDGTSSDTTTIFTAGLSTSTWYHVAVVGSSGSAKVYVDGVAAAQNPTIGTATQTNAPLFIGVPGLAANPAIYNGLNGFIDDLRITKGVARYTTTFPPPTKAFPDL